MKSRGKFSKWAWLVLVVAFAAIAGGGCLGSSSGGGGDSSGGDYESGNVTEIDISEHPLAEHLRGLYHKMPEGTLFLSEKLRGVSFPEMKARLKAAYESGKIIGMYAPTRARIEELHDALGVDIFLKQTPEEIAATAGEDAGVEFYMIKRHDGLIFQNRQHYVGKGTPGAEFYQRGPFFISGDQEISDYAVEEPVVLSGDKSEAYPRIAAAIAAWNGQVAEHAVKVKAEAPSVRDALRAAEEPNPNQLDKLAHAIIYTDHFHFPDQECGLVDEFGHPLWDDDSKDNPECKYKFPTIYMTATMYSCYSFEQDANWYMVVMNASMNNEKNYHHWVWTTMDFEQNATRRYCSEPEMLNVSDPNDDAKLFLRPDNQPKNYNDGYNKSDGFSFNVGGSVGFTPSAGTNSGVSLNYGLSAGIGISHTQSFNIQDYKAIDHTNGKKPWTEYEFSLPAEDNGFLGKELHEASDASRTNFTSEESWSWKVARSENRAYSFAHNFSYDVVLVHAGASYLGVPLDWIPLPGMDMQSWERGSSQGYVIDLPIPPTLAVSVKELSVNARGRLTDGDAPVKFDIFSDGDWTLESDADADWVTISQTKGVKTSQQEITLSILPNPNPEFRYAWITATGTPDPNGKIQKTAFQITQEPDTSKPWAIFVDPVSMDVGASANRYSLKLTSDIDWIASCSASWVHLDKTSGGPTGSSPVEITFTVDENTTSEDRYADVIVRDSSVPYGYGQYRAVRITQPAPVLEVDRTSLEYGYYSGPQSFSVLANVDWTVSTDASWIHPDKTRGSATGDDPQAVKVSVAQNLGPARSGKIVVSDAAGQTKTVNVSQAAPELEVDPTALKFSYYPGPQYLNVLSDAGWTASCDADWVVLSPTQGGQTGSTPQKIKVSLYMNGGAPRSADIVVRDAAGQTKTIRVNQGSK